MKTLRIFAIAFCICVQAFGQLQGPKSGSQPKSFSSIPDNLGFLSNSINLPTGQVQFSMPVLSIGGRGSVKYSLSLFYSSSNVKNIVNTWNREAPTSVVGLGWSLNYPKIICDHKATATREDDDFFLSDDGSTVELAYSGTSGSDWVYLTKPYQPWKILYTPASEKWTVIHEDGTKYIYGDNAASARKTIQYVVKWANWIGNGYESSGQSAHAYIWNLSEVVDTWGDKLTFEYIVDEEQVRSGGVNHTKASYLKEVKNLNNDRLTLTYQSKTSTGGGTQEYIDIHTEGSEPDAYQEKYESKYLDKVGFYNGANELLVESRFSYTSHGTLEFYKRQLSGITQYNGAGNSLPGYAFTYITATGSSDYTGALSRVTSPTKGYVNYVYDAVTMSATSRDFHVDAVSGYAEPKIFAGDDYVVVTRRQLNGTSHDTGSRPVRIDVYTWDGGSWVAWSGNPVTLTNVTLVNGSSPYLQNFSVVLGKDFFATLHQPGGSSGTFTLNLFGKSEAERGKWVTSTKTFTSTYNSSDYYSDVHDAVLLSGEDFVFVGSKTATMSTVKQFIYTFDDENWYEGYGTRGSGSYVYAAANNYYISHKHSDTDVITLRYQDKAGNWNDKEFPSGITPNTDHSIKSYWHATNSFAVLMGYGTAEYIYWWQNGSGSDYGTINYYNPTITGLGDDSHVNLVNNTMTAVAGQSYVYAFRFTGSTWSASGQMDYYGPNTYFRNLVSYGDDYVLRPRTSPAKITLKEYNPNSSSWSDKVDVSTGSTNFNASIAGNSFITFSGKFYFRNTAGTWNLDANTISYSWLNGSAWNDIYMQAGLDFVTTGDPYYPTSPSDPNSTFAARIKNGALVTTRENFPYASGKVERVWDRLNTLVSSPQTGANTLVTYFGPLSLPFNYMEDATELHLYRAVRDGFKGTISVHALVRMETNDGVTTRYSGVEYDPSKATVDATGTTPFFNRVRTFADDDLTPSTKPLGYTDQYFHIGLPSGSLTSDGAFPTVGGNSDVNYKRMMGAPYKTYTYDNSGSLKTKNIVDYEKQLYTVGFPLLRPIYTKSEGDGISTLQTMTYNGFNIPTTQVTENLASGAFNTTTIESTFFSSAYDITNTMNMISSPVYQKRTVDGVIVEATATKYKNWDSDSPGPFEIYNWRRTSGTSAFSAWAEGTPPSATDWRLTNKITQMDVNRGLIKEMIDETGVYKSTIWHATKPLALAHVSNAQVNQVAYEGFEDCTSNCSTDAVAGAKSNYNANWSISGLPSGTYKVTYWKKTTGGGAWSLIEATFTGTSYTITGTSVWIDEVRVHPPDASMSSASFDKYGNKVTQCDPNNFLSYVEYDEFHRVKLVRDKDKNIIESNLYNVKN